MKKLIIYALIAYFGWNYYQDNFAAKQVTVQSTPQSFKTTSAKAAAPTQRFSCDGRQHCSQMRSRAEAEFFVRNCPNTKMDGDHDGVPCENDSRF